MSELFLSDKKLANLVKGEKAYGGRINWGSYPNMKFI